MSCTSRPPCFCKIHDPLFFKPFPFDGESYRGFRVSLRLVRDGLKENEPVRITNYGYLEIDD